MLVSVWLGAWGGPHVCALDAHSLMLTASSLHASGKQRNTCPRAAGPGGVSTGFGVWGAGPGWERTGAASSRLRGWEVRPERRRRWGAPRGLAGCPELGVLGRPAGRLALGTAGQVSFHPKLLCLLGKSRGEGLRPGTQVRSWATTLSRDGWLLSQRRCWCRCGRGEGRGHPGLRRGSADPTL